MDESSEIKFLKAKVALLETEKKHEAPRNILSPTVNVPIIHEENQPDYPTENFFIRRKAFDLKGSKGLKEK
jgi:hypothetical protein